MKAKHKKERRVNGMTPLFNPAELATWQQAKDLALQMANFTQTTGTYLGGGVVAVTSDPATSGIYVPSWSGGPGGFPEPSDPSTDSFWLHFRFANGVSGINVGLILDRLKRYNNNVMYVFSSLAADLLV
jgi:hypothetical protein